MKKITENKELNRKERKEKVLVKDRRKKTKNKNREKYKMKNKYIKHTYKHRTIAIRIAIRKTVVFNLHRT